MIRGVDFGETVRVVHATGIDTTAHANVERHKGVAFATDAIGVHLTCGDARSFVPWANVRQVHYEREAPTKPDSPAAKR